MGELNFKKMRVAFQGEPGAFSEAAAVQLLGEEILTVPRPTFDSTFRAITDGAADALLVPVYDLLLESALEMCGETILPIEHNLIGLPGAKFEELQAVASHPMALAQCERFFETHPRLKRVPAEDTAGSVREIMHRGDPHRAAIAGQRAAVHYRAAILRSSIQDNAENFTRFVLLLPAVEAEHFRAPDARKIPLPMRLAHKPGALLACLEPFAANGVNLLKIESRPIHGSPWEYQFYVDVEADRHEQLEKALSQVRSATSQLRILGKYAADRR